MLKLHLGCGNHIMPGWKNLDLEPGPGGIVCDLRKPLPEESESVDYIFTEHFIEHLSREDGVRLLRECYRVLKPGGVIRVVTPDLHMIMVWYTNRKLDVFAPTWEPKTPARFVNEAMREWGHQFVYDSEELVDVLKEAGFPVPFLSEEHGRSDHEALDGLEVRPNTQELIVEATK